MARNIQMQNPATGDVKVIPNELVDQYTARGWKKTTAKTSSSSSSSSSKK